MMKGKGAIITVLLVVAVLSFYLPSQNMAAAQSNPLALVSSSAISCDGCQALTLNLPAYAGNLIVLQVALSPQSTYLRTSGCTSYTCYDYGSLTSISTPGVIFRTDFQYTDNPGSGDGTKVWLMWTVAAVTGTMAISGMTNNSLASWSMIGAAITGVNDTSPFDSNPSQGGTNTNYDFNDCNLMDGCSTTFSTTAADTMVITGIGSEGSPALIAPPTNAGNPPSTEPGGFTLVQPSIASGWIAQAMAERLYSSAQSNASTGDWGMTWPQGNSSCSVQNTTNSCGESALWYAVAIDACSGAACEVTPPISATSTTTGTSVFSSTTTTGTSSILSTAIQTSTVTVTTTATQTVTSTGTTTSTAIVTTTLPAMTVTVGEVTLGQDSTETITSTVHDTVTATSTNAQIIAPYLILAGAIVAATALLGVVMLRLRRPI